MTGLALREGNWKWIPQTSELFNIASDLEEKDNLASSKPDLARKLNSTLNEIVEKVNRREMRTLKGTKRNKNGEIIC